MITQWHGDFVRKQFFAGTGIRTHDHSSRMLENVSMTNKWEKVEQSCEQLSSTLFTAANNPNWKSLSSDIERGMAAAAALPNGSFYCEKSPPLGGENRRISNLFSLAVKIFLRIVQTPAGSARHYVASLAVRQLDFVLFLSWQ